MNDKIKTDAQIYLNASRNAIPPHRIAEKLGITLKEMLQVMVHLKLPDWGPIEYYPYILACRSRDFPDWPEADRQLLRQARIDHDTGRLTLIQYHGQNRIVQYAIPHTIPLKREAWFTAQALY